MLILRNSLVLIMSVLPIFFAIFKFFFGAEKERFVPPGVQEAFVADFYLFFAIF
jgi:hypothetical protein